MGLRDTKIYGLPAFYTLPYSEFFLLKEVCIRER